MGWEKMYDQVKDQFYSLFTNREKIGEEVLSRTEVMKHLEELDPDLDINIQYSSKQGVLSPKEVKSILMREYSGDPLESRNISYDKPLQQEEPMSNPTSGMYVKADHRVYSWEGEEEHQIDVERGILCVVDQPDGEVDIRQKPVQEMSLQYLLQPNSLATT